MTFQKVRLAFQILLGGYNSSVLQWGATYTVLSVLRMLLLCLETAEANLHISNILTNAKGIINLQRTLHTNCLLAVLGALIA